MRYAMVNYGRSMEGQSVRHTAFDRDETALFPREHSLSYARGLYVWFQGEEWPYADLVQGYSTTIFGHCDEELVTHAARALRTMDHIAGVTSWPREALATALADLTPIENGRVYFDVGGAQIVSMALRLASRATGRGKVLGLRHAFHGYSAEGEVLSREFIGGQSCSLMDDARIETVEAGSEEIFPRLESGQHAAFLVEPIQGANGLVELPSAWLRAVREACRASGTLLISDEVQVGVGRTGTFAAIERFGIEPDIVAYGKALCAGVFPLSALVVGERVYRQLPEWPVSALGSTFSCSPFACSVGLHVVRRVADLLRDGRIDALGATLLKSVRALSGKAGIESVRGYGMGIAIDFRDAKHAKRFVEAAHARRMLLYACGSAGNVVKLYPPYTIEEKHLEDVGHDLLKAADDLEPQGGR
jgi:4-aminobutyrate aminotransferase-like enzyme